MTLVELLPFVAIAAAFWLLIIRPSSVRRKAQAALIATLAPGPRIMTTAGVFATVVAIDGERISVEVAPGVVIEMLTQAIAQVVPGDPAAHEVDEADEGVAESVEEDGSESDTAANAQVDESPTTTALTPEADRG